MMRSIFMRSLEPGFGQVSLVELLSGQHLIAIETDEDMAGGALVAVRTTALVPEGTIAAEPDREAEVEAPFALGLIAVGGGLAVGTTEREAVIGVGEVAGVVQVGAFVIVGQQRDDLGLTPGHLSHLSAGFAIAVLHIAGHKVGKEAVLLVLAL